MAPVWEHYVVILYFSGVRGVERYEHASLAASLKKMLANDKNNYHTVCSYSTLLFNH